MNRYFSNPGWRQLGRTLAAFATVAACASAMPVSAATLQVLDRNFPPEMKVTGAHFDVDETTGRVRLAVEILDESFEGSFYSEEVLAPGLSFDRERREIRYESRGASVTCAVRKKVLWATTYPETGACRITIRNESRILDEGLGLSPVTSSVVELAVDEPTRTARLAH